MKKYKAWFVIFESETIVSDKVKDKKYYKSHGDVMKSIVEEFRWINNSPSDGEKVIVILKDENDWLTVEEKTFRNVNALV